MTTLQDAIDWAWSVTPIETEKQIWVAEGSYVPTKEMVVGKFSSRSFHLPPNTRLYGGFAGATPTSTGEATINARPGNLFVQTVLEGKQPGGRVSHVVYCAPATGLDSERAELNGFRIVSGLAVDHGDDSMGAAVFARATNLVVRNCEFADNVSIGNGGAIHWEKGLADVIGIGISKSRFTGNGALMGHGGAVYADKPSRIMALSPNANPSGTLPHIHNCEFDDNIGGRSDIAGYFAKQGGGAVYAYHPGAQFSFDGNVFSFNEARGNGSAILLDYDINNVAQPPQGAWITNNTFFGNKVQGVTPIPIDPNDRKGGVVFSPSGGIAPAPVHYFANNIVWGNSVTTDAFSLPGGVALTVYDIPIPESDFRVWHCDIEGPLFWNTTNPLGVPANNINVDPIFASPFLNDFRLQATPVPSPCINSGLLTGAVDQGDVDDDLIYHLEPVPFAPDIPSLFFKGPTTGITRVLSGAMDMGAMEQ